MPGRRRLGGANFFISNHTREALHVLRAGSSRWEQVKREKGTVCNDTTKWVSLEPGMVDGVAKISREQETEAHLSIRCTLDQSPH